MDDLDEFLDKITVTPQTDRHPAMETDEDFLAFLDTPTTFTRPTDGGSATSGNFSLTTQSVDDSNDFLDWLQDSTSRKSTSHTNLPAIVESDEPEPPVYSPNSSFLDTTPAKPRTASTGSVKEASRDMDNFFNEVFGSPSPSTKSRKTLSTDEYDAPELSYEESVQAIVLSAFPDIQALRRIVLAAGYAPNTMRAQVWSLLLNESCAEDQEVLSYTSEGVQVENSALLASDVAAVVATLNTGNTSTKEVLRKDMHDILSLYCARRQVAYNSVYCRLLAPLLVVPEPASRAAASSCFYSLASEFAPLINLNVSIVWHDFPPPCVPMSCICLCIYDVLLCAYFCGWRAYQLAFSRFPADERKSVCSPPSCVAISPLNIFASHHHTLHTTYTLYTPIRSPRPILSRSPWCTAGCGYCCPTTVLRWCSI